jgi:lysine-ketoglutarate reductase/saccharopine dehydrogenase-like protein (TIGR00300 family)
MGRDDSSECRSFGARIGPARAEQTGLRGFRKETLRMSINSPARRDPEPHVEQVEIRGHIIDSLILPKVLDCITSGGGTFRILKISVGQARTDPSFALIEVAAESANRLEAILAQIADHGAVPTALQDVSLVEADLDGAFPEGFYSSTNQRTDVRLAGHWVEVADQEMDCGIAVDRQRATARCLPMIDVKRGTPIVVGHAGVRVFPAERNVHAQPFEFMGSSVSTEKPKGAAIAQVAAELFRAKHEGAGTLLVAGPAVVHSGSGPHLCRLIRGGYFHKLFAGNALAAHDIEQALFGTSLGVRLDRGDLAEAGHEHHLRAINRMRRAGGIQQAVAQGILTSGILYECMCKGVQVVLAGSIRDDGPLPEVITDVLAAQQKMREAVRDVSFCLMIATALHSIAVGNLLPAWVRVVCVDINPSMVIKLADRGTLQTSGLVTDVQPFLRALVQEIEHLEKTGGKP